MTNPLGKKVDTGKIAELYISRLNGDPDALRLVMNMLADNVTSLDKLRDFIIRHEFNNGISKSKTKKEALLQQLSETYGLSKSQIKSIIEV